MSDDTPNEGVRWLRQAGVTDISPLGARVAELLEIWLCGIYNYRGAAALDWRNDVWFEMRYHISLSTYDNQSLTRLVFLAHHLALRVEISPHSRQNLMIHIHPRDHAAREFYQRHPTLEDAVASFRRAWPAPTPPAAARELLAARQLIRLLRDTLMECGEHQADCERGMVAGHDCACGLDMAVQLACEFEPPPPPAPRTPADIDAWMARVIAESAAARQRIFGPPEVTT